MGSGKNTTLQQIFTPKRRKGKSWDADTDSGSLWIWAGRFKRWKHTNFNCQQPGLLTYQGHKKKGKSSRGGSINLHGAAVEASPGHSRMFTVRTPEGKKAYLRVNDPSDREACMESIRKSGSKYGALLNRASLIMGQTPMKTGPAKGLNDLQSTVESTVKAAKISSNDLGVAYQLRERVRAKLQEVEPYQLAFQQHLEKLQNSLSHIAGSLDLSCNGIDDALETPHRSPSSDEAAEYSLSRASLHATPSLRRNDSFQSALSELQRSPSIRNYGSQTRGFQTERPLSDSWHNYLLAIEEAFRSEATRVVELQLENQALKAGMRNFKKRAQDNAQKLRTLMSSQSPLVDEDESSDSEDLDLSLQTPRQASMDDPHSEDTGSSAATKPGILHLSTTMNREYQQALEALEVVQRHAFALNSHEGRDILAALPNDEPPEEPDVEYEENSDDGRSLQSKPSMTLPENIQGSVENVWEIVAQRDHLPQPAPLQRGFSIWSVLKSAIGKDLTRITLPATINEPLSALQRVVEDLEYRHLLDEALLSHNPAERMALVAAFIASGYSATLSRESKPFNPLLGETFEWQSADQSCRFLCEQVSHHPPVSCWWSDSKTGWQYWGEIELRSKFWGKSVEMMPTGTCWLALGNELYSWNKANMSINNIILGTYWLDWYGSITITNHTAGFKAEMKFPKSSGRQLDHRGTLSCAVCTRSSGPIDLELQGKYTESMKICYLTPSGEVMSQQEVFRVNPPAAQGRLQYNMTQLAMTLNAPEPELLRQLPPTDSRLRPDQRALEDGELERATDEKLRLEEKQRQARKIRKERGETFFPCWFKLRTMNNQQEAGADHWLGSPLVRLPNEDPPCLWEFTGSYWEAKQRSEWAACPDIYSDGSEANGALPSPGRA